jgi:hypothetical protein
MEHPLPSKLMVVGGDGEPYPVTQEAGLGIREHDDVMLAAGYSRTAHIDFQLNAGQFAVVVLTLPADIEMHHAESRSVHAFNSPVDVKIVPNWTGALPAVVSTLAAFNQKGAYYDPNVKSVLTFRGTNIAVNPINPTLLQVIDHVILRATTGQGVRVSSEDEFASVTGRFYYEGKHVALFQNIGSAVADISYRYNWHEK